MKELAKDVLQVVVTFAAPYRKAVVAFLLSSFVAWLNKVGVTLDADTASALEAGCLGLLTAVLVYLVPNTRKQ